MSTGPRQRRRTGVFGGTFDPPHVGHLLAAVDAAEQLRLETVLWIPAGTQPLKRDRPVAPPAARLAMVELTVQGTPRFAAEPTEVLRGGLSFTVDTLEELRGRDPEAELFLLLGEDSWRTFAGWREPGRIRELASVAVLVRAGGGTGTAEPPDRQDGEAPLWLETRRVDVSATEVRDRVRAGLPIRGFVLDAVERYIAEQRLYR